MGSNSSYPTDNPVSHEPPSKPPDQLTLIWGVSEIGDSNIVPQIVGSPSQGPQNKVPLVFGNSNIGREGESELGSLKSLCFSGLVPRDPECQKRLT